MNFNEWKIIFKEISNDLNLSFDKDLDSAKILEKLLINKKIISIEKLKNLIFKKNVYIFGAGPSLEEDVKKFKNIFSNKTKIVADGATTALLENNILPDIIVTDLDGKIDDQIKANSKGSIAMIHAHGDNIDKIKKYVLKFEGDMIGTIQTNSSPFKNIVNFGGFTDGDRAVYLADHLNANKINLIGFDFDNKIGKYSFADSKDIKIKLKKQKWCKYLIENLNNKTIEFL